ncbi:MAG TPA: hypothetical protein VMR73_00875 [Candidatus Paceibacterota bacterium]|nr:hypothetical protein [Candidatus Paceibacterota bacterium]
MNIKETFTRHHLSSVESHPDAVWERIVYLGFVLVAISIIFHAWLFFLVGNTAAAPSVPISAASETIDRAALDNVLSNYTVRQNEKTSQFQIDTALIDPSK